MTAHRSTAGAECLTTRARRRPGFWCVVLRFETGEDVDLIDYH
ncbi:MAG: hypothetical protein OXU75_13665 [Deltaproteobacteria bacterium]|nr:hypothetical protein [Deltaproteobacteria bacterium]